MNDLLFLAAQSRAGIDVTMTEDQKYALRYSDGSTTVPLILPDIKIVHAVLEAQIRVNELTNN